MDIESVMKFKFLFKKIVLGMGFLLLLSSTGCSKEEQHAFLFWCVRPEQVTKEIRVEGLTAQKKSLVENKLRQLDGFVSCTINNECNKMTIQYNSSATRYMNFERILEEQEITVLSHERLP